MEKSGGGRPSFAWLDQGQGRGERREKGENSPLLHSRPLSFLLLLASLGDQRPGVGSGECVDESAPAPRAGQRQSRAGGGVEMEMEEGRDGARGQWGGERAGQGPRRQGPPHLVETSPGPFHRDEPAEGGDPASEN